MTRRGRRMLHISAAIVLATMLSLTSSYAFAGWTAGTAMGATVNAASISLSSSGISTLGPHSYAPTALTRVSTVTFANSGTAPIALSAVTMTGGGTLGSAISFTVWTKSGATCAATAPTGSFSTNLANGTRTIAPSFSLDVPAGATAAAFCVATTFTGSAAAYVGQSVSSVVAFSAGVGNNWTTADTATAANRTFSQSVPGIPAPTITGCSAGPMIWWWTSARITWTAPVGYAISSYDIYVGSTLLGSVAGTATQVDLNDDNVGTYGRNLPVTIRAVSSGVTSGASNSVAIDSVSSWPYGNVRCA
ncbi:MAG: hypothetical protein ACOH1T_01330 [Microbacteriaceae bacterium]